MHGLDGFGDGTGQGLQRIEDELKRNSSDSCKFNPISYGIADAHSRNFVLMQKIWS